MSIALNCNAARITTARSEIDNLALENHVSYRPTRLDATANAITRLSDDDAMLDEIQLLLVALYRSGAVSKKQASELGGRYAREKFG